MTSQDQSKRTWRAGREGEGGARLRHPHSHLACVGTAPPLVTAPPPLVAAPAAGMARYPPALAAAAAAALAGAFSFGFQLAVLNTSLAAAGASLGFDAAADGASVASAVLAGALGGALGAGPAADAVGPRAASVVDGLLLALGSLLAAAARSRRELVFGRFLAGVGVGAASLLAPRYLTEIAPRRIRGCLSSLNQLAITGGVLCAFALGWPYERDAAFAVHLLGRDVAWWRVMLGFAVLPALAQALGMAASPESPAWLAWWGAGARAGAVRRRLHGATAAEAEAAEDEAAGAPALEAPLLPPAGGAPAPARGFAALAAPRYRRVLLLALGLPLLQQLGGINVLILWGTQIFRAAGVASPVLANLLVGGVNFAMTAVSASIIDRAGRRPLLVASFAGMAASLAGVAGAQAVPGTWLSAAARARLSVAGVVAYIASFGAGCGSIPWSYLHEIVPPEVKGPATGAATALNWAAASAVGATFPSMLRALGLGGAFAVYAFFCAGAAAFCAAFMVETKRRPLPEVWAELMGAEEEEGAS